MNVRVKDMCDLGILTWIGKEPENDGAEKKHEGDCMDGIFSRSNTDLLFLGRK